jgi:toxin ParE1/3/4
LARQDLDEIWLSIATDNVIAADELIDSIADKAQKLSQNPKIGVSRPELTPSARSVAVGNYIVIYQPDGLTIVVLRIVHGARDYSNIDLPTK